MKTDIMVSVLCTAYNHEKYIRESIESVLAQKTDFKYEYIIHDDASTDTTADIIKEYAKKYPDIIRPVIQTENQFKKHHIEATFLFPIVRGKYIAFCEGDDYWIDENKLQKQIDFMESHPEYSMCMHNAVRLNNDTGEKQLLNTFPQTGTYNQEEQILLGLGTNFPAFASYVLRTELLKDIPEFFWDLNILDYPIRQYYANKGDIYYFAEAMSVYRVSVQDSYMSRLSENQEFYNNYTLQMIRFFERYDAYTEYKYHHLIGTKILSDYVGFCLSIEETQGIEKAVQNGLNGEKVTACYKCLKEEYLDDKVYKLKKKVKHLFVYGTGRVALICKKQLEWAGIEFEGFVISDGQMKPDVVEHKKVLYLSEALAQYEDLGFILAVQPINTSQIESVLKKHNIDNYCMPYLME